MKTAIEYVQFMKDNNILNIVWAWFDCPLAEKERLNHGGDEDYVVIYNDEALSERVVDRITVCDENTVYIGDTGYRLSVTAHS